MCVRPPGTSGVDGQGREVGDVTALGLDETLFCRVGRWRTQVSSTQVVDVVEGRKAVGPAAWLAFRGEQWCSQIEWATLDLSGLYRSVFDTVLPDATQVADPFHVVKLANSKLDECRRRVQNETVGHRGRKDDPLCRIRRLLTKADERLTGQGRTKLVGLLAAGDPDGEVTTAWQAREAIRQIYTHTDSALAGNVNLIWPHRARLIWPHLWGVW